MGFFWCSVLKAFVCLGFFCLKQNKLIGKKILGNGSIFKIKNREPVRSWNLCCPSFNEQNVSNILLRTAKEGD